MAGKRYKHPDTLQDRRPQRVKPPLDLVSPGGDLLGDDLRPIPPAPAGLLGKTRSYWVELHRGPMAKVLLATDGFPLHRYIWNVDQWLRTTADLARVRRVMTAKPGYFVATTEPTGEEDEDGNAILEELPADVLATKALLARHDRTWRLWQVLRQLEGDLNRAEQAYGLNPLARMRLNIAATEAVSGLDKLNRQLDQGERDPAAEPEYVEPD